MPLRQISCQRSESLPGEVGATRSHCCHKHQFSYQLVVAVMYPVRDGVTEDFVKVAQVEVWL